MTDGRALTKDIYGLVPMPSNDNACTVGNVKAMMWVTGSNKKAAMKTWLECLRTYEVDEDFQAYDKEKFFEQNQGWNDEMWSVYKSQTGFDKPVISEYIYGLSAELTTIDQELGYAPADLVTDPISALYCDSSFDWNKLKEMYSGTIDTYIPDYNNLNR